MVFTALREKLSLGTPASRVSLGYNSPFTNVLHILTYTFVVMFQLLDFMEISSSNSHWKKSRHHSLVQYFPVQCVRRDEVAKISNYLRQSQYVSPDPVRCSSPGYCLTSRLLLQIESLSHMLNVKSLGKDTTRGERPRYSVNTLLPARLSWGRTCRTVVLKVEKERVHCGSSTVQESLSDPLKFEANAIP